MERTPDDPNNEPTRMAGYDYADGGYYSEPASHYGGHREPTGRQPGWPEPPEQPPTPWYLRPVVLIGWGVLTAILLTALVWGMVRLATRESGHTAPATTSVWSTTAAPTEESAVPGATTETSQPPATTTEPSTTQPSTTTTEAPTTTQTPSTTEAPSTTAEPSSTEASTTTQAPTTTAPAQPPSEIVIPLPPGL